MATREKDVILEVSKAELFTFLSSLFSGVIITDIRQITYDNANDKLVVTLTRRADV